MITLDELTPVELRAYVRNTLWPQLEQLRGEVRRLNEALCDAEWREYDAAAAVSDE